MKKKPDRPRGSRRDAKRVKLHPLNALMPYIMPRRCDSLVYFDVKVNMTAAVEFVKEQNESGSYPCKLTYMHLFIASLVKLLSERPHLNSYIANGGLYFRDHIDISLAVKKRLTEDAVETTAKIRFDGCTCLHDVVCATAKEIYGAKNETEGSDNDKVYQMLSSMPRFILRMIVAFLRYLQKIDRYPDDLYKADPMHSSVFISNLGSIGLDATYHHLFEWGNCSIFAAMGVVKKEPVVNDAGEVVAADTAHIMVTIDERTAEGIKFAKDLMLFKTYMEDPAQLL